MKLVELADIFGVDILHALAWSLLHSLWQVALLAGGLVVVMAFTRSNQAALRYQFYAFGMVAGFVWSIVTFFSYFQKSVLTVRFSEQGRIATIIPLNDQIDWLAQLSVLVNQHLSFLVLCWSLGFVTICCSAIYSWFAGRNLLRHDTRALPPDWDAKMIALAQQLGVRKTVSFRISNKINVPCVVAYFKPVVLLPASLLLGMSPQQIEAIVLHELAHIRRHDILLANLQSIMKAFYFFNPFILWMSAKLDQERENACDDMAVSVCQNPLLYAQTLHHYAEMHAHFLSTTTSLIGRKNMLKHRIQRLFQYENKTNGYAKKLMSMIVVLGMGISTAAYAWIQIDNRNAVNLSANNLPIKLLLQQAEQVCPGSTTKVKLRQPDLPITASFSNLACTDVPTLFTDIEERFGMKFTKVQFADALKVFQQQCPAIFRDIKLKNPTALYSVNMLDVTCLEVLNSVAAFDAKPELKLVE